MLAKYLVSLRCELATLSFVLWLQTLLLCELNVQFLIAILLCSTELRVYTLTRVLHYRKELHKKN